MIDNAYHIDSGYHYLAGNMDKQLNKAPTMNDEPAAKPPTGSKPLSVSSEQLLGEHGVAFIIHQGECYQLRQTKAGKLILTK
ncbi:TPA: hemin uptake protein HemP [Yersinia enterocolitica]|uniref:hemin uptake protein HemP n=1 Tax=Yersinia enterocolitica TaxID=630 RepID=UPI0005E1FDB3|nr:hemin uptake protein HemP [Yersinia enterocolitica]EKN3825467.1 hemin uptake protein HemP [Yersinia enterocolitica]EKN4823871.1 hemin uptake protein HemP [Yersinia enterocolitica]EKN5141085.1 hemin uptake protein HemP [Yersinia enterocolitica]EKN5938434.1 hemin uptake protein HemP [Yersinia enterocolitica]EKN6054009.1 hemin uptake protein HemP [Yersinia enterocolitica]